MNILDMKFYSNDLQTMITLRVYLKKYLQSVFIEGYLYPHKPDVYVALIRQGFVEGRLTDDDAIQEFDKPMAYKMLSLAIRSL